jgi:hypothetical protein
MIQKQDVISVVSAFISGSPSALLFFLSVKQPSRIRAGRAHSEERKTAKPLMNANRTLITGNSNSLASD